jgi:hypothetical protein
MSEVKNNKRKKVINNDNDIDIKKRKLIDNNNNDIDINLKLLENQIIKYNTQNKNNEDDDDLEYLKRKIQSKKFNDWNVEFICSKDYNNIYNHIINYVNKNYDTSVYHLEDITRVNETNIFKNFHIEKLFDDKDIDSIKTYVYSFVLVVNNAKESLKIVNDENGLSMLKMGCFVRFFIIRVKDNCNINSPEMNDIFSDVNNIESVNINSMYDVIMDRKIIIDVNRDKLDSYYIFIKWILDDIIKDNTNNGKFTYYYGHVSTYPMYLEHNFGMTYDKIKHMYMGINYKNNKQLETNDELRRLNKDLSGRIVKLEDVLGELLDKKSGE